MGVATWTPKLYVRIMAFWAVFGGLGAVILHTFGVQVEAPGGLGLFSVAELVREGAMRSIAHASCKSL